MSDFQDYPMLLVHPNYRPSIPKPVPGTEVYNPRGEIVTAAYSSPPEFMAPVTVPNETERQRYEAQGYKPAGKGDPAAWAAQKAKSVAESGGEPYVHQEYPKWVAGRLVNDEEEEAAAHTGSVAIHIPAPEPQAGVDPNAPDVAALMARIAELEAMKDKRTAPKAHKAA